MTDCLQGMRHPEDIPLECTLALVYSKSKHQVVRRNNEVALVNNCVLVYFSLHASIGLRESLTDSI